MVTDIYKSALPHGFSLPSELSGLDCTEPILVAFSGGSDSTVLLHALYQYSKISGSIIYAAHVNHGIRGAEADADEQFCRRFAEKLGVEIFVLNADVPAIARESGDSIETAARRVRYDFFDEIMEKHKIRILATAHNANDNLETLIFNIARGTGLGGICGIPESRPVKNGTVIRPMLRMEKSEILNYCTEHSLDFVTDSTNTDTDYTRNLIRAEIIPVMQSINSEAVKNASRMCSTLREDSLCLESMTRWFVEELGEGYSIEVEKLCGAPASIVNRALIRLFDELTGGKTLEQTHINAIRELAARAVPHSSTSLPGGYEGVIEDKKLCLRKKRTPLTISDYQISICDEKTFISQTNAEIFIGNSHNAKNVYKKEIILYIDFDKIKGDLFARPRRAGDRIRMNGMSKSLKKMLCDKKIPLSIRERIPVICDDCGIVAVPFLGIRDGAMAKNKDEKNTLRFYLY